MVSQFLIEMTEAQRNEYFRLQRKIEKIKQVAVEIEAERKDDPIMGEKEDEC